MKSSINEWGCLQFFISPISNKRVLQMGMEVTKDEIDLVLAAMEVL